MSALHTQRSLTYFQNKVHGRLYPSHMLVITPSNTREQHTHQDHEPVTTPCELNMAGLHACMRTEGHNMSLPQLFWDTIRDLVEAQKIALVRS